jgi:hypothetical protein
MKLPIRMIVFIATLIIALSPLSVLKVAAQEAPITDDQISRIRSNCVSTVSTLNQLHASDALLRVNRGQLYESISSKLMVPFNTRVSQTAYSTSDLKSITNSYQHTLDAFRTDYQTYEQQLSDTLNINCSNQPVEFYDSVLSAETDRTQVYTDTTKLDQYITQYQTAVSNFELNYTASNTGATE